MPEVGVYALIYQKKVDGYPIDWMRSVYTINDVTADALLKTIWQMSTIFKGRPDVVEFEERENTENVICHSVISKIGDHMALRQATYRTEKIVYEDGSKGMLAETIDHPDWPLRDGNKPITMQKKSSMIEKDGKVIFDEVTMIDMGGYMPAHLLNMTMAARVVAFVPMFV